MKNRSNKINRIAFILAVLVACFVGIFFLREDNLSKDNISNKIVEMADEIATSINNFKGARNIAVMPIREVTEDIGPISDYFHKTIFKAISSSSKRFNVFEKSIVKNLLQELNLGNSDLIESQTYIKINKIAGVDVLVMGSVNVVENKVQLKLRAIDVSSSQIIAATQTTLPLENIQSIVSDDTNKKKDETKPYSPNYFLDKMVAFITQNWSWLWTIVLVPIGGWFLRWRKKKSDKHSEINSFIE